MPTFANRKTNIALGYCDQPGIRYHNECWAIFLQKNKVKFCVIKKISLPLHRSDNRTTDRADTRKH